MALRAPLLGIGCDVPQELAAEVLRFSVLRHSRVPIPVIKLHEAVGSEEIHKISHLVQHTLFSFQRFMLARLMLDRECDVAVYLDSDMLMLRPIDDLITLFAQTHTPIATVEPLNSWRRRRQSSVLLMTREGAAQLWSSFQCHLAGEIGYDELIYLRGVGPVGTLPYQWNCLEYLDEQTALLHYTDMDAQPWLWDGNPNAGIWYTYLWLYAQEAGGRPLIEREIARGHVRPALASIVESGPSISATSAVGRFRDLLFVPPHRFRSIRSSFVRKFLAPLLRGAIHVQFVATNRQPNIR